jgi:hypothetical protein
VDFGLDVESGFVEGFGEEHAACAEFVFAGAVAFAAGEEDDFVGGVGLGDEEGAGDEQAGEARQGF